MVTEFWQVIVDVINGFTDAVVNAFQNITQLFYVENSGFTLIGQLLLIGLGMSIVYWAFRFIRNLIRR